LDLPASRGLRPRPSSYSTAEVKAHFQEVSAGSLKRLQMDHVDILYNHAADSESDINSEGCA
jgi:aryl-alcohol dehydrogenase-like predicted oxidoreductase